MDHPTDLTLYQTTPPIITILEKESIENFLGKGENAVNQHFLLFSQCFQSFKIQMTKTGIGICSALNSVKFTVL